MKKTKNLDMSNNTGKVSQIIGPENHYIKEDIKLRLL